MTPQVLPVLVAMAGKGVLTGVEVNERVQKLTVKTQLLFRWLQQAAQWPASHLC